VLARPAVPGTLRTVPTARHLRPAANDVAAALRRRRREVWPLVRRGADLGFAVTLARTVPSPAAALAAWRASEAVFLPGLLGDGPARHRAAIERSLAMFDRLRAGGTLLAEFERRLRGDADLRYSGTTTGGSDAREREKVFLDAAPGGTVVARDLWAMLSWIANDTTDRSLRIRFSSGSGKPDEWLAATDSTCGWVDAYAARAFPEGAAILHCRPLRDLLQGLLSRPYRLSERIVYNNAPGGGAVFHHDAEPSQLGVVFSQLEGHTAWLAIGKRRLAALLVRRRRARSVRKALALLDDDGNGPLWRLLNRDASFTAELAARGALFVLRAGDCIVLPSHGPDDVAWHSVIALGRRPSLAHSYGIFARAADYPLAGDPFVQ
jgi:hypothetical protein